MTPTNDVPPSELRAHLSPVSERFAAVELGGSTVLLDRDEPDRRILADCAVPRTDYR